MSRARSTKIPKSVKRGGDVNVVYSQNRGEGLAGSMVSSGVMIYLSTDAGLKLTEGRMQGKPGWNTIILSGM